ncbi:RES family NAD+ phosphorylase [Paenibacillus alkalitolerans]|uniref:RES family NAD+ phosphorylase n=1 Tax=Paenibacillus alkalitolerans TaxID=2799335 RepID=UPI0018F43566|nr:RES family NAD+ phosphorylase [Paenibacillus alkalitolerans]
MKFCSYCIVDGELQPIIEGLGQVESSCPVCGKRRAFIYDTDVNTELIGYFNELLEYYTPESMLPPDFPAEEKKLLVTELTDRWHIFNTKLNPTDVYRIMRALCAEKYGSMPNLFDAPVGIAELNDIEYLKSRSLLRSNSWDDFVESVKIQNRFHTNHIELDILNRYCSFIRKVYKKGTAFFRGRISPEEGFPTEEMGAPPSDKATAGRANSAGIRCLYLASDLDTTIHEIRAGVFDYISIGRFELTKDIVVVDLKAIDHISPFFDGCDFIINKEHLRRINMEIGRALRRSDSVLDYIPTQYIADFIKSISHEGKPEYAGIEYNSTINLSGQNLAIFYPELFVCTEVEVYHIKELRYDKERL